MVKEDKKTITALMPSIIRIMTTTTKDGLISFVNGLEIWGHIQLVKSNFRGLVVKMH